MLEFYQVLQRSVFDGLERSCFFFFWEEVSSNFKYTKLLLAVHFVVWEGSCRMEKDCSWLVCRFVTIIPRSINAKEIVICAEESITLVGHNL